MRCAERPVPSADAGEPPARFGGRSTDEAIVLSLCALGAIGVLPFLVARTLAGQTLLAAIDAIVLFGVLAIAVLVGTTRRVRLLSLVLSVFYLAVMVVTVNIEGPVLLAWAYPTIIAAFFLVRERIALGLGVLATIGLLPVLVVDRSVIEIGTGLVTLALTMTFAYVFAAQTTHQRTALHEQAHRDPLTRAGNRRALEDALRRLVELRERSGEQASLILFDLDHFKRINDEHGHETGDQLLVEVVDLVNQRLRRTDSLFRIGGEEFVAVARGADTERTRLLAEDLRARIEAGRFTRRGLAITMSLGVAEVEPGEEAALWLRRADEALYGAKNGGRNTTRCHQRVEASVA